MPMEYLIGARSWVLPGVLAGAMKLCKWIGLNQPGQSIPALKIAFGLESAAVGLAIYAQIQGTQPKSHSNLRHI